MLRHRFPLFLAALCLAAASTAPAHAATPMIVGPSQIYFVDADSVLFLATKEWQSAAVRHQEKLLRYRLRMEYWSRHLPGDMRRVFDELGYPTGRLLLQPTGHSEEWWYYGQLASPIRFRDGALLDADRVDALLRR